MESVTAVRDGAPPGPDHPNMQYLDSILRIALPFTDAGARVASELRELLTGDICSELIVLTGVGGPARLDVCKWAKRVSYVHLLSSVATFPRHRWVN